MFVPTTPVTRPSILPPVVERKIISEHVGIFAKSVQPLLNQGWVVTHLAGCGDGNYFCAILEREKPNA